MQTGYKELKRKASDYSRFDARPISLGLKLQVMFGHTLMMIGIVFTFLGLLVFIVFGSNIDFNESKFDESTPTTSGKVTNVIPTNSYVNDVQVFKYEYEYYLNSKTLKGECHSTGNYFDVNQNVTVQYLTDEIEISKIEGTRKGAFEIWIMFVILPFIFIGGSMLGVRILFGIRAIKLLEYGEITYGTLIDKQPTNTKINNQTVYKLSFQFTASNGNNYTAIAKTHTPYSLEDEQQEKLVYDANNPEKAVLIDSLPKTVKKFFMNFQ